MILLDEVTRLVERGHSLPFVKSLDLNSFQSLAESSERVWKAQTRFATQQQMVAAQGTAKALKEFMKGLAEEDADDQKEFIAKFGGRA